MHSYRRRIELLGDALRVKPSEVIRTLRSKNLHYFDASGAPVLDAANWTDERLVEAAFRLFIEEVDGHASAQLIDRHSAGQ